MLHVEGGTIKIVNGSQSNQKVLTTDDTGVAKWEYANGDGGRGTSTFIVGHFTNVNNTTDIFHLKTPFNWSTSDMYMIKVEGYAYGSGVGQRIIDVTFVGYCYQPDFAAPFIRQEQTAIENNTGITAGQYVGSDGFLYLWFKTPRVYFNSFGVTSMYVGNGRVLKKGDITVIQSPSSTL